ncbi:MAG: endonuclease III [Nitrospirae bacterium]|nr:MAG: endonuclease III [Nitrospirota bacterium]
MNNEEIHQAIRLLKIERRRKKWPIPVVGVIANETHDPFKILIACVLSLRTKDQTTASAARRLFELAQTPETMAKIPLATLQKAIYPVGFYRSKAKHIRRICLDLLHRYGGVVPSTIEELIKLKGVGRKTANLVVTIGYGKPGICVDTHVHRICNRWGYVNTPTPDKTEAVLRQKLPIRYWIEFNDLLVPFGQYICRPVSPWCSRCCIEHLCYRIGVNAYK